MQSHKSGRCAIFLHYDFSNVLSHVCLNRCIYYHWLFVLIVIPTEIREQQCTIALQNCGSSPPPPEYVGK